MSTGWFRLPATTTAGSVAGEDEDHPKYLRDLSGIAEWRGHRLGSSPEYIMHVRGTDAALTTLGGHSDVDEIDKSGARTAFENTDGVNAAAVDTAYSYGDSA